jgi:hypothetical protein
MKLSRLFGLVLLSSAAGAFAAEPVPGCVASRVVPFDTFMQGQLASVPISVPVPKAYEAVTAKEMKQLTYSYWMAPKEVKKSLKAHQLPVDTGYMYGKLSLNVAYLRESDRFSPLDDDSGAMKLLDEEQISVNGHTLLFRKVAVNVQQVERKVWMFYLAMNIDTNAAYFTFVPAKHDEALGDCFWKHLKAVVKASPPH